MRRDQKLLKIIVSVIVCAMLLCAAGLSVNAESLHDRLISALAEKYDDSINNSYISSERIFVGDSVVLHGAPKGVDPSKCTYAFYFRPKGLMWFTLSDYSEAQDYIWSPTAVGDYEVCIKIKFGRTIGAKYYDLRVTRELVAKSYASTSFLQLGNTMELCAIHQGGFGNVSCGFFYKRSDEELWSTLSEYGPADYIKWRPTQVGDYELCIKVKDQDGQMKEDYYSLTVSETLPRTPTEFVITVKSPIASPYFWKCSFSDEDVLDYYITEKPVALMDLRTYVVLEYHFRTKSAGRTDIDFSYDTYSGEKYSFSYDVTVDRNLNYRINSSDGNYLEKDIPEPEQVSSSFSISVCKPDADCRWTCDISDNLVADIEKVDTHDSDVDTYRFTAVRKGSLTIAFTCKSVGDRNPKYKLIYDLTVDDDLNVSVYNKDGIYQDYTELPDPVQ